jgi:hypothetical protein
VVPTGARREHRPAAGGDQDGLGREAPLAFAVGGLDVHPVLVQQTTVAAQHLDPGLLKKALVDPFQAVDLPVLVGDEARPVEGGLADLPAEAGSVLEVLVEVAGIMATLAPACAAMRAARTPPEPPPMTKRSRSWFAMPLAFQDAVARL